MYVFTFVRLWSNCHQEHRVRRVFAGVCWKTHYWLGRRSPVQRILGCRCSIFAFLLLPGTYFLVRTIELIDTSAMFNNIPELQKIINKYIK